MTTRRVRTISRKGQEGNGSSWNPQRPYVEHLRQQQMKIWSELHGDVESWAELETTQPPSGTIRVEVTELSEIPCRVSSDLHEWRNDFRTVSARDSAKLK